MWLKKPPKDTRKTTTNDHGVDCPGTGVDLNKVTVFLGFRHFGGSKKKRPPARAFSPRKYVIQMRSVLMCAYSNIRQEAVPEMQPLVLPRQTDRNNENLICENQLIVAL